LDWYLREYAKTPESYKKQCVKTGERNGKGAYKLTIGERKRILIDHIFGVDIDTQAVEVTKLSLLLKALEGLNEQEIQKELFNERVLPDLSRNIKCGNSLIGSDFYVQGTLGLSEDEQYKINAFDWKTEFADVFKDGGFDAVIGNPPYVFTRGDGFTDFEKEYYYAKFKHQNYQLNTFAMFVEQGYYLIKNDGVFGFIIPNNWLTIGSMKEFRDFLISSTENTKIVNNLYKVFSGANVDTSMLVFKKNKPNLVTLVESSAPDEYNTISSVPYSDLLQEQIIQFKLFKNSSGNMLIKLIGSHSVKLGSISTVKSGLKAYETGKGTPVQTDKMKNNRIYHNDKKLDKSYRPYLEGRDVKRYHLDWSGQYLKYGNNLAAPRKPELFEGERILVRQIPSHPPYSINGALVNGGEVNDINSMIIIHPVRYSLKFILGIINSRLITYWFDITFDKFQRVTFPQFKVNELEQFPIFLLDLSKKADKDKHDKLVALVDQMIALKQKEQAETLPQMKTMIGRQIQALDKQIDTVVYELYGLSEEEIKVVEGER
jgi:hypothetical protein